MGAPTKYKPEFCDMAEKLCKLGLTDGDLADVFEVKEQTVNNWKIQFPEFFESIKKGRVLSDANVAQSLYNRAIGYSHKSTKLFKSYDENGDVEIIEHEVIEHYPPETAACVVWLCNRRRDLWRRNPDPNGGPDDLPPTTVVFEVKDARTRDREEG